MCKNITYIYINIYIYIYMCKNITYINIIYINIIYIYKYYIYIVLSRFWAHVSRSWGDLYFWQLDFTVVVYCDVIWIYTCIYIYLDR